MYLLFLQNGVAESSDDIAYHKPVCRAYIIDCGSESDCCVSSHHYNNIYVYALLHTHTHALCSSFWHGMFSWCRGATDSIIISVWYIWVHSIPRVYLVATNLIVLQSNCSRHFIVFWTNKPLINQHILWYPAQCQQSLQLYQSFAKQQTVYSKHCFWET